MLFINYINQHNLKLEINSSSKHYGRFILHLKGEVGFVRSIELYRRMLSSALVTHGIIITAIIEVTLLKWVVTKRSREKACPEGKSLRQACYKRRLKAEKSCLLYRQKQMRNMQNVHWNRKYAKFLSIIHKKICSNKIYIS